MDYLGGYTLHQCVILRQQSLFLHSRVSLFVHIARALSCLADKGVAHMDLSTNNVFVVANLLIKLIDFGEAHHPKVCDNNYQPGHTLPSCPP